MKIIRFLTLSLAVIMLATTNSGCEKDETQTTGTVKVIFVNHPSDLGVGIAPAENTDVYLFGILKPDEGVLEKKLNGGNYLLIPWSPSVFYNSVGFQIIAGETTVIRYGDDNAGYVE